MHSTLCRAFAPPQTRCAPGEVLWRSEPESGPDGSAIVLVQSTSRAVWERVGVAGWLARVDPPVDLTLRLGLERLTAGTRFRYRLRANPCVTRDHKRLGLMQREDQEQWLVRQGRRCGFQVPAHSWSKGANPRPDVSITQERMLRGRQRSGNGIRVWSVMYDGSLEVTEPVLFITALRTGIGHGKAMGLGLLSIAPIR